MNETQTVIQSTENLSPEPRRTFKRIGFALFAAAALMYGLSFLLGVVGGVLTALGKNVTESGWFKWVASFVPLYAVGVPVCLLILRKVPAETGEKTALGGKNFFIFLLMCFPLMYGGNILGTLLSSLLSGGTAQNALLNFSFDDSPLKIIVMAVLAPLIEEYLFRKQLIDRCAKYGEKAAVFFSALCFGLFHMNLYQFFYAFGLGLLFGYVYLRTRRLRYPVLMHMTVNFMGSVIAPLLLSSLDMETVTQMVAGQISDAEVIAMLPELGGFLLYVLALIVLSIVGLVLLILKAPKLVFLPDGEELPKEGRFKTIYANPGMIFYVLFCLIMIAVNLFIQ